MTTTTTTTATDPLGRLSDRGVAVWLDELSREMIVDGTLERLVRDKHVVGVTTNPTIFATALRKDSSYDEALRRLAARGATADEAVRELTTEDVRMACDVLREVHERTGGRDGRASLEVSPHLADDARGTIDEVQRLGGIVDRPNLLIKIPATAESLGAIATAIGEGFSVNVTLIFALDRYRAVMDAYVLGLETAEHRGINLASIQSVASFFVSRVDSEVDARLDRIGSEEARALRGRIGLANARLAYLEAEKVWASERWQALAARGANIQRLLWASTSVKDPSYPDAKYVAGLVAPHTVDTMPMSTLHAFDDHGTLEDEDPVRGGYDTARSEIERLERLGVSYDEVTMLLERQGVQKFVESWNELRESVSDKLAESRR
jgi:transaldolase